MPEYGDYETARSVDDSKRKETKRNGKNGKK